MAKIPIEIIDLRDLPSEDLQIAVTEANRLQNEVEFITLQPTYADALRLHVLSDIHSGTFFDALAVKKKEWRGFHPFMICFVNSALHSDQWSNLFGTRRAEAGTAIVTSFGVEGIIVPTGKMSAYYLYELASHTLAFIVSGKKHHQDARGCIFDFKRDKRGIVDCMRAGALCDECRAWFIEKGHNLSPSQLSAIMLLFRRCSDLIEQVEESSEGRKKPRIFVGSSAEGLEIARAIQSELQFDYSVEIWNQNTVFGLGDATIEALEQAVNMYDFGIFVFTPDDNVGRKGHDEAVPRDNVIFESGLFIGRLSRLRAYIVCPRGVGIQLPSDLRGLTIATYDPVSPSIDAALGPACRQIRLAIARMT